MKRSWSVDATSPSVNRPAERSAHASPIRSPERASASSTESRRSSSSASSVTVPGVTTRVTLRSTRPFAAAGSPICSQIAALSPIRISFER